MRRKQHTPRYASRPATVAVHARPPRRARPKRASGGLTRALLVLVGVMVALVLLGGGAYALVRYLHGSSEYVVHTVRVEGASLLTPEAIVAKAGLKPGKPILTYDIHEARRKLIDDPLIQDAAVTRVLPDMLAVRVVERTPLARLALNGTIFLVDRRGFLLTEADAQETLPLIEGVYVDVKDPKPGMQIEDEDQKLATGLYVVLLSQKAPVLTELGVKSINVRSLSNVRLTPVPGPRVADNAVVSLGEDNFERNLARLGRALEYSQGKRLYGADLRPDKLPPFDFR